MTFAKDRVGFFSPVKYPLFYHLYITVYSSSADEHTEYFANLKNLIEDTYTINGNKKVVLIVHSLGGLMALTMLHEQTQSWRDKYIRSMISLSGAWGGSAKAVKVYAIGECTR